MLQFDVWLSKYVPMLISIWLSNNVLKCLLFIQFNRSISCLHDTYMFMKVTLISMSRNVPILMYAKLVMCEVSIHVSNVMYDRLTLLSFVLVSLGQYQAPMEQ